jgi:hypothetical protein
MSDVSKALHAMIERRIMTGAYDLDGMPHKLRPEAKFVKPVRGGQKKVKKFWTNFRGLETVLQV